MMAPVKLIAALVVALSAIALGVEAERDLWHIGFDLGYDMGRALSEADQADAEKVYSFAENYINALSEGEKQTADEFLKIWRRLLNKPDQCDESSLEYVVTIYRNAQEFQKAMTTLFDVTKRHARKCLTSEYISSKTKSVAEANGFSSHSSFKKLTEFIDDQFIADYWSKNRWDWTMESITVWWAARAIANSTVRHRGCEIKYLEDDILVNAFLENHFYEPCKDYKEAFFNLRWDIQDASYLLEGGYEKLMSSLDKETRDVFFRCEVCKGSDILDYPYQISHRIVDEIKRLNRTWWFW